MRLLLVLLLLGASAMAQSRKEFLAWTAAVAGSAVADVEVTQHYIAMPNRYEINPILGHHPSRGRMYETVGATDFAAMFIAHKLQHRTKYWQLIPAIVTGVHVGGVVYTVTW